MFRWIRILPAVMSVTLGCGPSFDCKQLASSGGETIAMRDIAVTDATRAISVKARLISPDRLGPATRLVIVSMGLGAELTDFDPLAKLLAASDYAVAVVEHRVSTTAHVCGDTLHGVECWHALEATETHAENWDDRFSDVLLLMDKLPALLDIDSQHIGLVGHSFGAFTTMALGGTTYVDPRTKERRDRRDPRVVSVVAMSPQGPRWFGLDAESWRHIDRPLLLLTGDKDGTPEIDDSPEWRREPFPEMSGGDKLMLRIHEGDHMVFTSHEKRPEVADLVRRMTLAFLNETVRKGSKAEALTPEVVKSCSRGHASLERR